MESNPHFFLRLALATACRMSLLMLASSFLVGTRFSSLFLWSLSNGGLL
jgi:hypothetical protein